jgi:hypothetical protein
MNNEINSMSFFQQHNTFYSFLMKNTVWNKMIYIYIVTFGIFAHVNFPVPLHFFFKCRTISTVNKCHQSN